jgi:HEAT repeat protein
MTRLLIGLTVLATFGAGCAPFPPHISIDGIATVEVVMSSQTVRLRTGLDTPEYFGQKIHTEDLLRIVERRNRKMKGKPEVPHDHETTRGEYKVMLAASLLGKVREPQAFDALVTLAQDPYGAMRGWAVASLRRYGDRSVLPMLVRHLKEGKACNGVLVPAIGELGDDSVVPLLIDTVPVGGYGNAEARLKAIEAITGLSLKAMREDWGRLAFYGDKLPQFRRAMHQRWATNKHESRNGMPAQKDDGP